MGSEMCIRDRLPCAVCFLFEGIEKYGIVEHVHCQISPVKKRSGKRFSSLIDVLWVRNEVLHFVERDDDFFVRLAKLKEDEFLFRFGERIGMLVVVQEDAGGENEARRDGGSSGKLQS